MDAQIHRVSQLRSFLYRAYRESIVYNRVFQQTHITQIVKSYACGFDGANYSVSYCCNIIVFGNVVYSVSYSLVLHLF